MTVLLCTSCGAAVEENPVDGTYEALDGSRCAKNEGVHRVEQVIPDQGAAS